MLFYTHISLLKHRESRFKYRVLIINYIIYVFIYYPHPQQSLYQHLTVVGTDITAENEPFAEVSAALQYIACQRRGWELGGRPAQENPLTGPIN